MDKFSYLSNIESSWVEDQYRNFLQNPESVEESWRKFFEGFEFAHKNYEISDEVPENVQKEFRVMNLINGYRSRGHLFTKTNPVRERRRYEPTLDIQNFGLDQKDLEVVFQAGTEIGLGPAKLTDIINHLEETYCKSIGAEFYYIRKPEKIKWLLDKMEGTKNKTRFEKDEKKHILHKLNQAVVFENFLHTRFPGQKRFSLEGAEVLIPGLDALMEHGAELGVSEYVLGMAHRGRLNVLANIFNKTYRDIFSEFEPKDYEDALFDGDVKYHLGFTCDIKSDGGKDVHMTLAPNPSHLEAVDPVVEGISRAKIDKDHDGDFSKVTPILIHGDAAVAGQGVVYEVIQMAQLDGYKTGGTVHVVINNQVGFTTNYLDARSSTYCTDVAKVTLCPVFHVNGDDVEALVHTMRLAMEYRQTFNEDVFIDILCYRKHGHNEGDEPKFTQPLLYKAIAKHPNPREIYSNRLRNEGFEDSIANEMEREFREMLELRLSESKEIQKAKITPFLEKRWQDFRLSVPADFEKSYPTKVSAAKLKGIASKLTAIPQGKKFFRKLEKILKDRAQMVKDDKLDWGMCELLAYGTLLDEGYPVRITGQDVERGTFSHRHAVVKMEDSEEEYIHLNNLSPKQAKFDIYNSLLSEYAVMGFDYGYSLTNPNTLAIWEAQFGDFCNGAQIIIDQFLSTAEDKWMSQSGLVLLLPHGYEGQGAEHSSARLERFLQLAAQDNMIIANCTTPANFFHLIRRQLKMPFRKPLVVFSPKSLLRHPRCVSSMKELAEGTFVEVIDDTIATTAKTKTVVFCQGKIYYELLAKKEELEVNDMAIVRIEQMYPFPKKHIEAILKKYSKAEKVLWVQEEPENMGAWSFILRHYDFGKIERVSRPASASPASGSPKRAFDRQQAIINTVFQKYNEKITA
jgi:2-oxoglutarate dehydrogenase E1 component